MLVRMSLPDEITPDVISRLIDFHRNKLLPRYRRLRKYYELHHTAIENRKMSDASKPNNKLIHDYPGYITNMATGYFIGAPVTYKSNSGNSAYLKALQDEFNYNDEADENAEIAKACSIQGEAFELMWQDEDARTRFSQLLNEQTLVIYDTTVDPRIRLALRYYDVYDVFNNKQTKVEVYDAEKVFYYTLSPGAAYVLNDVQPHYFGEVPVIHYVNNAEQIGDFERVITLVDAYDRQRSNTQNDLDYFTDAYLKFIGIDDLDDKQLSMMRENRIIMLPNGQGTEKVDAEWLIKDINDVAVENHLKRLNADIHKFASIPDLSDENFAGDLSGIAIKFKLFCLEQLAVMKERKFKRALQRRIELMTNILNIKGGHFDYTDIDMTFTRNIPANITETINEVNTLWGKLPAETLLGLLPFVKDPAAEIKKLQAEQAADPAVNLDTVPPWQDLSGDSDDK